MRLPSTPTLEHFHLALAGKNAVCRADRGRDITKEEFGEFFGDWLLRWFDEYHEHITFDPDDPEPIFIWRSIPPGEQEEAVRAEDIAIWRAWESRRWTKWLNWKDAHLEVLGVVE